MHYTSRPTVVIGNWKMYKTIVEARVFVSSLAVAISHTSVQIGLAVPFTMIAAAAEAVKGTPIMIGGQNVNEADEGPFTGEISCKQLQDAGASFVIIGHSERRQLFNETDESVNKKVCKALSLGLRVVMCVGETLAQYEAGQTESVLQAQLENGLKNLPADHLNQLILAYEPVWAIGTNKTATPEIVQSVHCFCRKTVAGILGSSVAENMVIQYGGSVKPENSAPLLEQPDVDGLLVGSASLVLDSFIKIIHAQRMVHS